MKMEHACYGVIVVDATRDLGQRVWEEKDPSSLERTDEEFKRVLMKTFGKPYESGLLTL